MWFCAPKTESLLSLRADSSSEISVEVHEEKDYYLEPDRIAGAGPVPPTLEDELVTFFLSDMIGYIVKSIETEDCLRKVPFAKEPIRGPLSIKSEDSTVDIEEEEESIHLKSLRYQTMKPMTQTRRSRTTSKIRRSPKDLSKSKKERSKKLNLEDLGEDAALDGIEEQLPSYLSSRFYEGSDEFEGEVSRHKTKFEDMKELNAKLNDWSFKELDQMVKIHFINGNRYDGRMSRLAMEGFGFFTWANGQTYKGTFHGGKCEGIGQIDWAQGETYEGQVACNLRHGQGVKTYLATDDKMYHLGNWERGKKHGYGKTVYGPDSWYEGNWERGRKSGVGTRRYSSGAMYHGEWKKGLRHGRGTMVWANKDVYIGLWYSGVMDGVGKYIWSGFMNKTLVVPLLNSYNGEWSMGKRHGEGTLELISGGLLQTHWSHGEKTGDAAVICRNGDKLFFTNLFGQDRVNEIKPLMEEVVPVKMSSSKSVFKIRFHNEGKNDSQSYHAISDSFDSSMSNYYIESPSVPINAPVCSMDLTRHIEKLFQVTATTSLPPLPTDPKPPKIAESEKEMILNMEKKWLKKVLTNRMEHIIKVYDFYALLSTDEEPPAKMRYAMLRMMLWQLISDCGLTQTGINCYDFDELTGFGHNPLDQVLPYEMIHYLLHLNWFLYVPQRLRNGSIPALIASTFDRFITEVVATAPNRYQNTFLKYIKYMPLEPVYLLYSTFEQPLLVEGLCARLLHPGRPFEDKLPLLPDFYQYVLKGVNVISVDGSISYIPYEEPYFDINLMKFKPVPMNHVELNELGAIGMNSVVRCIKEAVPESVDPYTGDIIPDFKLTFKEWYKIILNVVCVYLNMTEDYYKRLSEAYETELREKAEAELQAQLQKEKADDFPFLVPNLTPYVTS